MVEDIASSPTQLRDTSLRESTLNVPVIGSLAVPHLAMYGPLSAADLRGRIPSSGSHIPRSSGIPPVRASRVRSSTRVPTLREWPQSPPCEVLPRRAKDQRRAKKALEQAREASLRGSRPTVVQRNMCSSHGFVLRPSDNPQKQRRCCRRP